MSEWDEHESVTEFVDAMSFCEAIQTRDGNSVEPHIVLKFKDFADANRVHRAIMQLVRSRD